MQNNGCRHEECRERRKKTREARPKYNYYYVVWCNDIEWRVQCTIRHRIKQRERNICNEGNATIFYRSKQESRKFIDFSFFFLLPIYIFSVYIENIVVINDAVSTNPCLKSTIVAYGIILLIATISRVVTRWSANTYTYLFI